ILHQEAPDENGRGSFSSEAPFQASRLRDAMSSRKSGDLSAKNRDRCLRAATALRNSTLCIRAEVRGLQTTDDLESLQRVYVGVQRIRPDSSVQGDSKTRRVSGSSVLAGFLTKHGGAGRTTDPYLPAFVRRRCAEADDFARPADFPEARLNVLWP